MLDDSKINEHLKTAYGIIRQQTEQICDLHSLIVPLLRALHDPEYSHLTLLEAYQREQGKMLKQLTQSKTDSLALVDAAIRRLKES